MKRVLSLMVLSALCALTGCGDGGVNVDGKLVSGTAAYPLPEGDSITLTLASDDGKTGSANVEKDGTFTVKGQGGKALAPGKYKVSIMHYHMPAATGKGPAPMPATPIPVDTGEVWDVSSSNKSFTLDMSKIKDPSKKK
jgi:predicted small lipoprotein YifL